MFIGGGFGLAASSAGESIDPQSTSPCEKRRQMETTASKGSEIMRSTLSTQRGGVSMEDLEGRASVVATVKRIGP